MKFILLLLFVSCATASFPDALDDHEQFSLNSDASVENALGIIQWMADETENDIKSEVEQKLREEFEKYLKKVLDLMDKGEEVKEELTGKVKELRQKLKDLKIKISDKARELLEKIKEKARQILKELLDKYGLNKRYAIEARADLKGLFKKLKDYVKSKIDKDSLKAKVEELFGKGSELADSLLDIINKHLDNYKQKVLDFIDRYVGKEQIEKRSLQEFWEKIKDYFKERHIDLKEKYMRFGEWVKDFIAEKLPKSNDKLQNIKKIAEEFLKHTKGMSKEIAIEALEFMKPYKEHLGDLWNQLKVTVKDLLNKRD